MTSNPTHRRATLLQQHPWVTFLLPFLVYMVMGSFDPAPEAAGGKAIGLAIPYSAYPWLYAAKIALTIAAVLFVPMPMMLPSMSVVCERPVWP